METASEGMNNGDLVRLAVRGQSWLQLLLVTDKQHLHPCRHAGHYGAMHFDIGGPVGAHRIYNDTHCRIPSLGSTKRRLIVVGAEDEAILVVPALHADAVRQHSFSPQLGHSVVFGAVMAWCERRMLRLALPVLLFGTGTVSLLRMLGPEVGEQVSQPRQALVFQRFYCRPRLRPRPPACTNTSRGFDSRHTPGKAPRTLRGTGTSSA